MHMLAPTTTTTTTTTTPIHMPLGSVTNQSTDHHHQHHHRSSSLIHQTPTSTSTTSTMTTTTSAKKILKLTPSQLLTAALSSRQSPLLSHRRQPMCPPSLSHVLRLQPATHQQPHTSAATATSKMTNSYDSTCSRDNTVLCSQERACGLFDREAYDIGLFGLDDISIENDLPIIDGDHINVLINGNCTSTSGTAPIHMTSKPTTTAQQTTTTTTTISYKSSRLAKIYTDCNSMKLNIDKQQQQQQQQQQPSTSLILPDELLDTHELDQLITPTTHQLCLNYLHSVPDYPLATQEAPEQQQQQQQQQQTDTDTNLFSDEGLLDDISQLNDEDDDDQDDSASQATTYAIASSNSLVELDHAYSERKRKLSVACLNDDDDSQFTQDDSLCSSSQIDTPMSSSTTTTTKKRRARGIYRADDVTNEEELFNYLERRKKNNVSSKVSRANKRSYYNEMDTRSATLQLANERLASKVVLYEQINQLIKDFMVEQISTAKASK